MVARSMSARPSRRRAVGQAIMRSSNLGTVLRLVRERGGVSRARIAADAGLSKGSVTSLIGELVERGLVREDVLVRSGGVGRPGTDVVLVEGRVAGIGVELTVDGVRLVALDLTGRVVHRDDAPLARGPVGADATAVVIAQLLDRAIDMVHETGAVVAGAVLAAPGVLDRDRGVVLRSTGLDWTGAPLRELVRRAVGHRDLRIEVDNDARLSAFAAYPEPARRGVRDLVFLTGGEGVAAGMIADGELIRGGSGFSGEVGHMMLDPEGPLCRCGRRGCWETVVGVEALLGPIEASSPDGGAGQPLTTRVDRFRALLDARDPSATAALANVERHLVRGVGLLVDVLDPTLLVLGGHFGLLADRLIPPLDRALSQRALVGTGRTAVEASRLGADAAATGGALLALENVLDDPALVPALGP